MGKPSDLFHRGAARALSVVLASVLFLSFSAIAEAQELGCTPDPSWGSPDQTAAAGLLTAVNLHRSAVGLPELSVSTSLTRAAEWKAAHMASTGLFAHNDPGRAWDQRIRDCGYTYVASENIGYGYSTGPQMLAAWLLSSSHRTVLEAPQSIATGVAAVTNGSGVVYWVQTFGVGLDAADEATSPGDPSGDPEDPSGDPDDPSGDPGDAEPTPSPSPTDGGEANSPPVAVDDVRRVAPRTRVKIVVLANDYDVDGDALNLRGIVQQPKRGRATFDPTDGSITYRARRGTAGRRDQLTYRIGDGNGGTDEGVVRFRIRR